MRFLSLLAAVPAAFLLAAVPVAEFSAGRDADPQIRLSGGAGWTAGDGLQLLRLDGVNGSWGGLAGTEALRLPEAVSVAVRFNCRELPAWNADPVSVRQDSATLTGRCWNWELRVETDGALSARVTTEEGDRAVYSPPGLVVPGVWSHAALSCDAEAGRLTLYHDGREVGSLEFPPAPLRDSEGEMLLLGSSHGQWNPFDGVIGQVQLYDRALSAAEIAELAATPSGGELERLRAECLELAGQLTADARPEALRLAQRLERQAAAMNPEQARDLAAAARQLLARASMDPELLSYVVEAVSDRAIVPDTRLGDGELGTLLRVVGARGEYEPASFVLRGLRDYPGLAFHCSDLEGNSGSIPADAVDLRLVQCWYQAGGAWSDVWGVTRNVRILVPELLVRDPELIRVDYQAERNAVRLDFPEGSRYVDISEPAELTVSRWDQNIANAEFPIRDAASLLPTDLSAGFNRQFWLTVHIPEDAPDGIYSGVIRIESAGRTVGELSLQLRVLPFDLALPAPRYDLDRPFMSSIYYPNVAGGGDGAITPHNRSWRQIEAELRNLAAHGVTAPLNYQLLFGDADLGDFRRLLALRRDCGLVTRPVMLNAPEANFGHGFDTSEAALENVRNRVRRIIDAVEAVYGHREVYFYGVDEAKDERITAQLPLWQAIREAGGKVFVAGYKRVSLERSEGGLDLLIAGGPPDAREAAAWHAAGKEVWMYGNPQGGVENPALYRRNYGFLLDQSDYDGVATYCYYEAFGHPWNDFDFANVRDHNMVYPTPEGVIDTIAWEGYREGIDDIRYITTLRQAVRRAREGGAESQKAAREASDWLARLDCAGRSPATLRLEIIRWIMKLEQSR